MGRGYHITAQSGVPPCKGRSLATHGVTLAWIQGFTKSRERWLEAWIQAKRLRKPAQQHLGSKSRKKLGSAGIQNFGRRFPQTFSAWIGIFSVQGRTPWIEMQTVSQCLYYRGSTLQNRLLCGNHSPRAYRTI